MLDMLAAWPGAVLLQRSGTAYLLVNAAHILGIGLLVGAILPLDLRLASGLRGANLAVFAPVLTRAAGWGLGLALATGLWLFTVKPAEYLANPAFLAKMALLAVALGNVGLQHAGPHLRAVREGRAPGFRMRILAGASAFLWISVLVAGRWIGFV